MEVRLRKDCECIEKNGVIIRHPYVIKMYLLSPHGVVQDTRFSFGFLGVVKQCHAPCERR